MDKTLKILEFDKILEYISKFAISDDTKLEILNIKPQIDIEIINSELQFNIEAKNILNDGNNLPFNTIYNLDRFIDLLKLKRVLKPDEILCILENLKNSRLLKSFISKNYKEQIGLYSLSQSLFINLELEEKINNIIDTSGEIKDSASTQLKSLRQSKYDIENNIKDTISNLLKNPSFTKNLQENIFTIRDNKYVFPIKSENKNKIDGSIIDISSTGSTYYIEPKIITQLNNQLKIIEIKIENEIYKILKFLCSEISIIHKEICENTRILIKFDTIFAKAKYSIQYNFTTPTIVKEKKIELIDVKNPILMTVCDNVIKNDFKMDENSNVIIITGSNTGGKTVILKTIGLCVLMAKAGLDIPSSDGAKIYNFSSVYADIGDEQNIIHNLSTFSSHLKNINNIIKKCDSNSLILLDEIASGTDPNEGEALAIAILEYIKNTKAFCLCTTHFSGLKKLPFIQKGFKNASVSFDTDTLKPTFKLLMDIPGISNAILIAQNLNVNSNIICRATEIIDQNKLNENSQFLEALVQTQNHIQKTQEQISNKESSINQIEKEYLEKLEVLKKEKRKNIINFKKKYQSKFEKAKEEINLILENLKNETTQKNVNKAYNKLGQLKRKSYNDFYEDEMALSYTYDEINWDNIKIGDKVCIKHLNQEAILTEIKNETKVQVQIGNMKMQLNKDKLAKYNGKYVKKMTKKKYIQNDNSYIFENTHLSCTLDLRGFSVNEALESLDFYLDKATLKNLTPVYVISGIGTGAIKNAIINYLEKSDYVSKYKLSNDNLGEFIIDLN